MPKLQLSSELRDALRACGPYFLFAGLFSLAINILNLTSPIYMTQVYDRVLGSGSEATLIMLTLACCLALAVLAGLDNVRSAVLIRAGIRFDAALSHRVVSAMVDRANASRGMERGQALRDLDTFRQFITGSTVHALFDAPWSPLYIIVEFLVHPLLGIFATTFAVILFGLAVSNEYLTRKQLGQANEASIRNYAFTESSLRNAEVIRALGMLDGLLRRWGTDRQKLVGMQAIASDRGASINSLIKFLRMFMQSLMLGAGAYLVIERQITPGSMFACTLLLGRALQPIEQTVGAWKFLVSARAAFNRVDRLLTDTPAPVLGMSLPRPNGDLSVDRMTFAPPGSQRAILNNITVAGLALLN